MSQLDHSPRYIKLTKGQVATVCAHDYERLAKYRWHVQSVKNQVTYYARRNTHYVGGRQLCSFMHREVNKTPEGLSTDHINRNKLDNRCLNLRTVTHAQNMRNMGLGSNNKSGVAGVGYYENSGRWFARVTIQRKEIFLGQFPTKQEAIAARRSAEVVRRELDL